MNALELLQAVSQSLLVVIAALVIVAAVRRPTRSNVDSALLFGGLAYVVIQGRVTTLLSIPPSPILTGIAFAIFMTLPYLLLRLARDFSTHVGRTHLGIAEIGLALSILAVVLYAPVYPTWVTTTLLIYFAVVSLVAAAAFVREARRTKGVTRRRMQSIAAGTALLGGAIGVATITLVAAGTAGIVGAALQVASLAAFLAWGIGFTPPRFVRRIWQEPELRAFLARAALLPRLPDTPSIIGALQEGAANSTGANAVLALWDEGAGVLRLHRDIEETLGPESIAWRVFQEQRAIEVDDPPNVNPLRAEVYARRGIGALIAAPITAGDRRLGVLVVYADRAPVFAEDDLELVQLLADQAAVILESRALIDEATRVRAHEEVARLKEDFVSAAAHDLKTPLTTIIGQAQLLERRAARDPGAPVDPAGLRRIVDESRRLGQLVEELLDASRVEQGRLDLRRELVDLGAIATEVASRPRPGPKRVTVDLEGDTAGQYDRVRIAQVVENLVENAAKYSPNGTPVVLRVWRDGDDVRISVRDEGIGIPADELLLIFDRFRRGRNVDDRRFAGMGLGLYICRGIVEEHGGRIWAESERGHGSTFHVALPSDAGVVRQVREGGTPRHVLS